MRRKSALFLSSLLLLSLIPPMEFRRGGGGGIGGSRGGGSRGGGGGGFGSRGSSGARTNSGGGWLSGGSKTSGNRNEYSRSSNLNRGSSANSGGSGGWNNQQKTNTGGNWNNRGASGGMNTGRWSSSGMGSRSRGDTFKNMIVGAAAGYLTYQAGKAIIRVAAGPMMWNNRPYYWGSNYYRSSPGHTNMCRMPIDSTDPQFGNVYFQDQSRPREITWGCGYYEYCCGYECCRGGGATSDRIGTRGSSIGYALVIAFLARRLL